MLNKYSFIIICEPFNRALNLMLKLLRIFTSTVIKNVDLFLVDEFEGRLMLYL